MEDRTANDPGARVSGGHGRDITSPIPAPLIRTFTGRLVNPLALSPDDVDIVDVAHALSNLCRFGGHTKTFYSVAQHSVLVSEQLADYNPNGAHGMSRTQLARWGLLHDASEAYLIDLPRPLKHHPAFGTVYREAEAIAMRAVIEHFNLRPSTQPIAVDYWDDVLVESERRDLCPNSLKEYPVAPLPFAIEAWTSATAEREFLRAYELLFLEEAA